MEFRPGQLVAHYRLVEKIGEGGMGVVWKAVDTKLGRNVALKLLPAELTGNDERRLRFQREARAAAALAHPNIAVLYEVGEHEGVPFISMEYLQGKSLREHADGRPLPLREWLRLSTALAEGLAHAHRQGIVHRDLKPDNVMITGDGQVKILDFGLAKLVQPEAAAAPGSDEEETRLETMSRELTLAGKVFGTVAYMSPEQARGEAVDHRSDVFSLGVLLYELASGRRPFGGKSPVETLGAVIASEPPSLSEVSAGLPAEAERLVRKALEKDPASRYQHADDLVTDLRNLRRDVDSGVASMPPGGAARPRAGRGGGRGLRLAGLAAVVVVAALVVGWLLTGGGGGEDAPARDAIDSIVVLPFESRSPGEDAVYLGDGIAESVINSLSRIEGLRVIPRSVAFTFRDRGSDPKGIADELGVRAVVTGRVAVRGESLVVGAELTDAVALAQLWGEQFNRTRDDVLDVQEEISREIAATLRLGLTAEEERRLAAGPTDNPEAYNAYLRGQGLAIFYGEEELEAARGHFERALAIDPDYALALAGLATVEAQLYRNFDPDPDRLARAEGYARRALAIDPDLARLHAALAEIHAVRYEYAEAADEYRKAIAIEPGDPYFQDGLSWVLAYATPPDGAGAEAAAREAIRLSPRFAAAYYHLGRALIVQGRHDEAMEAFRYCEDLDRNSDFGWLGLAQAYLAKGEYASALTELDREKKGTPVTLVYRGAVKAGQGERDEALRLLEEAVSAGYGDAAFLETSDYFDSLRESPRFGTLVRRAGNQQKKGTGY